MSVFSFHLRDYFNPGEDAFMKVFKEKITCEMLRNF